MPGTRIPKKERNQINGEMQRSYTGNTAPLPLADKWWFDAQYEHVTCILRTEYIDYSDPLNMSHVSYSQLQIGWHSILRLFLKLFQRTSILPMGFAISTT